MPYTAVMHKFKAGSLKSGSGHKVTDRKQAVAIMMSEKRESAHKPEYRESPQGRGLMAHHEVETIQDAEGRWINIHGPRALRAGQPLPRQFQYERDSYDSEQEALDAAERRSKDIDPDTERPRPGTPVIREELVRSEESKKSVLRKHMTKG